jgi:hypothetical protein
MSSRHSRSNIYFAGLDIRLTWEDENVAKREGNLDASEFFAESLPWSFFSFQQWNPA